MHVVEGADELYVAGQEHAVAEHVARHVPDTTTVKSSIWMSLPSSRKWRLTDSQAPLAVMPISLWS